MTEYEYGLGVAIAGFGLAALIWGSPNANPVTLCVIIGGVGVALALKDWLLRRIFREPQK